MTVTKDIKLQHPNVYNTKLPKHELLEEDRVRYLEEIRSRLSSAVLENDTGQCVIWVINLHKYIILYGLAFTRYPLYLDNSIFLELCQKGGGWVCVSHTPLTRCVAL